MNDDYDYTAPDAQRAAETRQRARGDTMSTTATQADAANRGFRTLVQGAAIDIAVAIAAALLLWLPQADVADPVAWTMLGTAVAKSVLTAIASYVMRLKVTPPAVTE